MPDSVKETLKELIIRGLRVQDVTPDQLADDQPLLHGPIEIDSIDILQVILEIEKAFGITVVEGEFQRAEWETIATLAAAIEAKMGARDRR
jgi:acyl carrier protein